MAIISKEGMKEIEMRAAEELARRDAARDRSSKDDRDEAEGAEDGYARGGVVKARSAPQAKSLNGSHHKTGKTLMPSGGLYSKI